VYSTCSLAEEENDYTVEKALKQQQQQVVARSSSSWLARAVAVEAGTGKGSSSDLLVQNGPSMA